MNVFGAMNLFQSYFVLTSFVSSLLFFISYPGFHLVCKASFGTFWESTRTC